MWSSWDDRTYLHVPEFFIAIGDRRKIAMAAGSRPRKTELISVRREALRNAHPDYFTSGRGSGTNPSKFIRFDSFHLNVADGETTENMQTL
jgi:hypothetical protein